MKLSELKLIESRMSELHLDMQEKIISQFRMDDTDALEVLEFALGQRDLADLNLEAREKLFSHYENKEKSVTPTDVKKLLKKDLGL